MCVCVCVTKRQQDTNGVATLDDSTRPRSDRLSEFDRLLGLEATMESAVVAVVVVVVVVADVRWNR